MAYSKQNFQDGQILSAANLEAMENGIIAGQSVENLLDNSDFTNPVNQRGKTSYGGDSYSIDRWYGNTLHQTVSIQNNYITVSALGTSYCGIQQKLGDMAKLAGKTVTFAVQIYSSVGTRIAFLNENGSTLANADGAAGQNQILILTYTVPSGATSENVIPAIICKTQAKGSSANIYWAALYEGSYTADTLPAYVPKGKNVEMVNCGVPLAPYNLLDNSDFRNPVNQLGRSGTYEGVSNFTTFVIDRWKTYSTRCTYTLSSAGLRIANINPNSPDGPYEELPNPERMKGKTYTLAVGYNGGNVACGNVAVPTGTLTEDKRLNAVSASGTRPGMRFIIRSNYSLSEFQILIPVGQTVTVEWAALYEGSYTADTLPAYVPKDKHVEMLNCGVPLAPHNLLDNSDFINPVNQRGETSYTDNGHTIDRWRDTSNATTIITEKGLTLRNNSTSSDAYWYQRIPANALTSGKVYTMAINVEGVVYCGHAVIDSTATATFYGANGLYLSCTGLTSDSYWTIQITLSAKKSFSCVRWVALYEGAYDTSTLPAYVPKGKHVEMLNCVVPLAPRNLLINSDFRNPINTIRNNWPYSGKESFSTDIIDMWRTWSNHCTYNITTNGMTISNSSTTGSQGPIQRILSGDNIRGKTVTLALGYNNGDIICGTVSVPSGTVTEDIYLSAVPTTETHPGLRIVIYLSTNEPEFQILVYKNKASTIQWAALYEGAYSIETLPSYISNSPLQEFVNCKAILSPRNLLDNSNFSNCINYNGLSSYEGAIYGIDKWYGISMHQTVSILSDSIKATANKTSYAGISQKVRDISKFAGKTVTFAAKVYSNVIPNLRFVDASRNAIVNIDGKAKTTQTLILTYTLPSNATSDNVIPTILCRTTAANDYINIYWAALYDGVYTADTLPNYQPKDRKIEILNCNVPLAPHNLLDNSDFTNPVNQRGATTATLGKYFIDRWNTEAFPSGPSITIDSNGLTLLQTTSSTAGIFQKIPDYEKRKGKIHTFAICVNNVWKCVSFTMGNFGVGYLIHGLYFFSVDNQNILLRNNKSDNPTPITIQRVALYEGAYTADTLPPYQPKGYAAELAECQRYFERLGVADSEILGTVAFVKSGAKSVIISMQYQPKRIGRPTISFGNVSKYRLLLRDAVNASVFSGTSISSFDEIIVQSPFASVRATIPNPLDRDCWIILQRADASDGAYIDVDADL